MSAKYLKRMAGRTPLWLFKMLGNLWFPFLGSGIKVLSSSHDFRRIQVCLKKRWYNSNYVGTQFGGSMYAMTDPFYMLMLINNLGRDFIVWDKAATIRFRKPGLTTLFADFEIFESDLIEIKAHLEKEPKMNWERQVLIKDSSGETVAEVLKTLHIRKKESARRS